MTKIPDKPKIPDVPVKEKHILFIKSGNRCAYPGCPNKLTEDETLSDPECITSYICHIGGLKEGSPRYDPNLSVKDGNSHKNLVLLCGKHHPIIDKQPKKHTVDYLTKIKEEHEKRIQSAVDAEFPKICSILHRRNVYFTGRHDYLKALEKAPEKGESAVLTQHAIVGLGGIGKTQIATEYSYRCASKYDVIWWIRSEISVSIASDFARLANDLNLPEKENTNQSEVVKAVMRWLENHPRWLLVFDNVQHPDDIAKFIPHTGNGHVIVTSRFTQWDGYNFKPLTIVKMPPDEAIKFLIDRTGIEDRENALKLADELGYLPLALEQAAAYITTVNITYESYLDLFHKQRNEILKRGLKRDDYYETVATTWQISFDKLKEESKAGSELLNICSFLAPENIPKYIFKEGKEYLPKNLTKIIDDKILINDMYEALGRFSLVELSVDSFSIHRLVQAVIQDNLEAEEKKRYSQCAVSIINNVFTYDNDDVQTWETCGSLMPHAIALIKDAEKYGTPEDISRLMNQIGLYQLLRAEYCEAKKHFERVLIIDEKVFGHDHPDVAIAYSNLGSALKALGDYDGAKTCYEIALKIDEKVLDPDDPQVAIDVNNIGSVLNEQGDYKGAKVYYERALKMDEKAFGLDHPKLAIRVSNLGMVLKALGDYEGAKAYLERALKIAERAFSLDHPKVAIYCNNLGMVLTDLRDYKGAMAQLEKAMKIIEKAYVPDHPIVALVVNNIGEVLRVLGDHEGARINFERALKINEKALGPDHPDVARVLNNLGMTLLALEYSEEAKANLERALRIYEKAFGHDHPDVANNLNNLGGVFLVLGDLKGAKSYFERALNIWTKFLGENHPKIKVVRENLDFVNELMKSEKKR